jgi:hypothetical protein
MGPSSGEISVFVLHLIFVILCGWLFVKHPAVSILERITIVKCHINTVVSPDDGSIVAPKHGEIYEYTKNKLCINLVLLRESSFWS